MQETKAIEIKGLNFFYSESGEKILNNLNLTVQNGEIISILGSSGCGKSTLLFCLNGIVPKLIKGIISGDIQVYGKNVNDFSVHELSSDIQIMFQNPESQFFTFNVRDEISFGLENKGFDETQIKQEIESVSKLLNIPHLLDRSVEELSSGEKQLVILASLIAMRPKILVLDEPTANLDPIRTKKLKEILKEINKKYQITIIVVEHDLDFVDISQRILFMKDGRLKKYEGELNDNYSPGCKPKIIPETILKIKNLHYKYDKKEILRGIDLELLKGEVLGIVGSNGSGKSTLAQNIMGLLKPTEGEIVFRGKNVVKLPVNLIAKSIGYMFQNPDYTLFENTILDEVKFGAKKVGLKENETEKEALQMLKEFGLTLFKDTDPDNLSIGQKRRVNIASLLLMKPEIIILDEPDTGLDRINSIKLMELLCLANKKGLTVVVISHNLNLIKNLCNRIVFIDKGEIVDANHYSEFLNQNVIS